MKKWLLPALLVFVFSALFFQGCSPSVAERSTSPRAWTYVSGSADETELQPGVSLAEIGAIDAVGAPGPQEAARRYLVSVATGDAQRFEGVTGQPVSEAGLAELRQSLYGQRDPFEVSDVFNLDLIAQDGDALLYHLYIGDSSGDFYGADVRVLNASDGQYGVLDARSWVLSDEDLSNAAEEVLRRKATDRELLAE